MGARVPVPYGVGDTVSGIVMVNPAGVIDVFSLYTRSTIVPLTCCYKAVVWLSEGIYSYIVLCTSLWWWRWWRRRPIQWRSNEFKSGRHMSGVKRRNF